MALRLALIGYGKMGKAIEEIAISRGHTIDLKITSANLNQFSKTNLDQVDVAIEFTNPHSAYENVRKCLESGTPVVCGSTGWNERLDELKVFCLNNNGAFIYSSNFSVGVNIFFEINKKLAELMAMQSDYEVKIEETHHTQKKDAPSATAVTLAEQVLEQLNRKKNWVNKPSNKPEELQVISHRIDPMPGTHRIVYESDIDSIEIVHTAHNRKGFALGAVVAAEFLAGKKGFFSMKKVLGIN